jgi:hypothetical protein
LDQFGPINSHLTNLHPVPGCRYVFRRNVQTQQFKEVLLCRKPR